MNGSLVIHVLGVETNVSHVTLIQRMLKWTSKISQGITQRFMDRAAMNVSELSDK